ncbi:MAG: glycosyltransferase family 4 protein [Chloroflexi bacterium]|nr:glycosyltransferase family 4 protein [Chloroflexota bacterium]
MHVALDARLAHYTAGGIAHYTLSLARALAKIAPDDRFTLLRSIKQRGPRARELPHAPNLRSTPLLTPPHHRLEQWTLPLEIGRVRPDVLHSPDVIPPFRRTCPAVVTVHDVAFLRFPETLTAESRRYYGQVQRAVQSAERTIVVSEATARDLADLLNVSAARVRVVPNGLDDRFRAPPDPAAQARVRARWRLDRPYLLFLGTLEPRKDIPTLLRAFAEVRRQHPDLLLALVGRRGWLYEPIFEAITSLTLSDAVRHIEDAADADLPPLFDGATAFAYPSLYEGFGLPVLEALARGTPTVIADTSSLPEVAGDAALRHPPGDADALAAVLLRLIGDTALRADLARRGPERAVGFTWERAARQTLDAYREARAERPSRVLGR